MASVTGVRSGATAPSRPGSARSPEDDERWVVRPILRPPEPGPFPDHSPPAHPASVPMSRAILIVGEDPALIDFSVTPPGVTAQSITEGLEGARDRLKAAGHEAEILWTRAGGPDGVRVAADQLSEALKAPPSGRAAWDVVVTGAGLRTLPPMALGFEALINRLHAEAPATTRIAFNTNPADSDTAALRFL